MYKLVFTGPFSKLERQFLKRHPELRSRYLKTLQLLELDPFHPSLRLHALKGKLQGLHSVSISIQYRITLELEIRQKEILLVSVGTHDQAY